MFRFFKKSSKILKAIYISIFIGFVSILATTFFIVSEFDSNITNLESIDYAIILGAGLDGNKPSERLKIRLDKGFNLLKDNSVPIILSGGKGSDELISEAESMKNYLIQKGMVSERFIIEDKSTSTYENFLFSKEIIYKNYKNTIYNKKNNSINILIITSDYHMFRAKRVAKKLGFNVQGVSAINPLSKRFKYIFREILAVGRYLIFY
ncbi:YdcF family protein [bacterium]|nr:YdcF family protein [bacterium]